MTGIPLKPYLKASVNQRINIDVLAMRNGCHEIHRLYEQHDLTELSVYQYRSICSAIFAQKWSIAENIMRRFPLRKVPVKHEPIVAINWKPLGGV